MTKGEGNYSTTAQEDNATLEVMVRAHKAGLVDYSRIVLLRTASDFDRAPNATADAYTAFEAEQGGFEPAIQNLVIAGKPFVDECVPLPLLPLRVSLTSASYSQRRQELGLGLRSRYRPSRRWQRQVRGPFPPAPILLPANSLDHAQLLRRRLRHDPRRCCAGSSRAPQHRRQGPFLLGLIHPPLTPSHPSFRFKRKERARRLLKEFRLLARDCYTLFGASCNGQLPGYRIASSPFVCASGSSGAFCLLEC